MQRSSQQMLIGWLCRIYGALLHSYPREFRQRYGIEMAQLFHDRCRDLAQTQDPRAWVRFVAHIAADWLLTTLQERFCSMRANNPSTIRWALVTGTAVSLAMMAINVLLYRPLLEMPGGTTLVLETGGLLIYYALLVLWATSTDGPWQRVALLFGTPLGLIGGAIQIAHLIQETFMDLGALGNAISGFALLFCTFVLWGVAGHRAARRTGSLRSGAMAGVWSAVVTMSMIVLFGFALEFYLAMPKPESVAAWGEFKRSGWTDVHAFTLANTIDSAESHLIAGPIIGAIFGAIGGAITRMGRKPEPQPSSGSA